MLTPIFQRSSAILEILRLIILSTRKESAENLSKPFPSLRRPSLQSVQEGQYNYRSREVVRLSACRETPSAAEEGTLLGVRDLPLFKTSGALTLLCFSWTDTALLTTTQAILGPQVILDRGDSMFWISGVLSDALSVTAAAN